METAKNDKNEIMVNCVNKKLVAAIKKLKMEIQRRIEHERELQKASQPSAKALVSGSYNIVVFLTICISYANNCFTL